uniref:Conserved oligomeric Golgi complex subunit 1 n=1 Tax=Tetraselmis sp. GSL018 TaxID=582737 RepID=A0A061S2P7_9CHLO|mmetsp:Transcript_25655/g.61086  ORF Transcript_25655/g.61086 Transcript_25655/m.61086 type:complete len:1050 (+) Transcript_25655:103-3252(+)
MDSARSKDVQNQAEELFETRTVAEARQIEKTTKKEIEHKKQSLRTLVGDSYRELISSADKIICMSSDCKEVLSNINSMQASFKSLEQSVTSAQVLATSSDTCANDERELLYAIGSRMKYLVDTPEDIWSFLDSFQYLEAVWRYLRAVEVYKILTHNSGDCSISTVLQQFPLLHHQWLAVEKFRSQIMERVELRLSTSNRLSRRETAVAVAAAASLMELNSSQVLEFFLEKRLSGINRSIEDFLSGAKHGPDDISQFFVEIANSIQVTICHIGEIFQPSPMSNNNGPLLVTVISSDDTLAAGELVFEGTNLLDANAEVFAWSERLKSVKDKLGGLSSKEIDMAAAKWLSSVSETFNEKGCSLFHHYASPEQLSAFEAKVQTAIKSWMYHESECSDQNSVVEVLHTSRQPMSAVGPFSSENAPKPSWTWQAVCSFAIDRQLDLWDLIFELPVMSKAMELINHSFQCLPKTWCPQLKSCLHEAKNAVVGRPGKLQCAVWPSYGSVEESVGNLHADDAAAGNMLWRRKILELHKSFEEHLCHSLQGCVSLMTDSSGASHQESAARFHSTLRPKRGRGQKLEPFIQDCCATAVDEIAGDLEARLGELPDNMDETGANSIEEILVVGRLAALLSQSSFLKLILGSPDEWYMSSVRREESTPVTKKAIFSKRVSPKLETLELKLSQTGMHAHKRWATWAALALQKEYENALLSDETLSTTFHLNSWHETVLSQDDTYGNEDGMRFTLPICPSNSTMALLSSACCEVHRIGGQSAMYSALQLFQWELGGAVVKAMHNVLDTLNHSNHSDKKISEKGVLQILMDIRFLRDVLSGGLPVNLQPALDGAVGESERSSGVLNPRVSALLQERKRNMIEIESMLQDRMDPIDWATYEPYLWANEACFYKRSSILFGCFAQLHQLHSEVSGKLPATAETNTINVLPAVARFPYLPVSQPNVMERNQASLSVAGPRSCEALDDSFSFADLGSRSLQNGGSQATEDGGSLAGLRSHFASKGAALGTLFSDRAAEVASIATSSFGDFQSLSSSAVFSSAFSSFSRR